MLNLRILKWTNIVTGVLKKGRKEGLSQRQKGVMGSWKQREKRQCDGRPLETRKGRIRFYLGTSGPTP